MGQLGIFIQISLKFRKTHGQITQTMYGRDLRIGEVVKRFASYNVPSYWPFSLNDFEFIFIFLLPDSETVCCLK